MTSEGEVISKLAKAKDNIRRKYSALKQGEEDTRSFVSQTFDSIMDPLKKIQKSVKSSKKVSTEINDGTIVSSQQQQQQHEKEYNYFEKDSKTNDIDSWFLPRDRDRTYGPRQLTNGAYILAEKEIKFTENSIILENTSYPKTSGLIELIFAKNPSSYTDSDLEHYK